MSKQLDRLVEQLNHNVKFTENPVDFSGYEDCKYFLCFTSTNKTIMAWKNQAEAIEDLKEIVNEGVIHDGSLEVIVVDETPFKQARREARMSQQAVADLLEIPRRTWQNWELGIRVPPHYVEKLVLEKLESLSK